MRAALAALAAASTIAIAGGCAMSRGQETVGSYVDDAAITSTVKARMVEENAVDATAINVETSNGSVVLSGVAKNAFEKSTAESIAMKVRGVKAVQNNLSVRP
jgi:hyperosmotically inducible periplasmic protein